MFHEVPLFYCKISVKFHFLIFSKKDKIPSIEDSDLKNGFFIIN